MFLLLLCLRLLFVFVTSSNKEIRFMLSPLLAVLFLFFGSVFPSIKGSVEREQVKQWGRFGPYQLVGLHEATNENCGKFLGHIGCIHAEDHQNTLTGNFERLIYDRLAHHSCNNFRCKKCYKYGAASREAKNIDLRLAHSSKVLSGLGENGVVEHGVLSVPIKDYNLSPKASRAKAIKILKGD